MWLYQYLNLVYPYFGQGQSEAEFVPQFFTDVMVEGASVTSNPFLNYTPDFIGRIYNGSKRLDRSKFTLILPKLSLQRMRALVEKTLTPDAQIEIVEDFESEGIIFKDKDLASDLDNLLRKIIKAGTKKLGNLPEKKSKSKRPVSKTHGFAATPSDQIYVKDGKLFVGADSVELPKDVSVSEDVELVENRYVDQLCLAFSQEYGRTIDRDSVRQDFDCGQQFAEQRINFYSADALRAMLEKFPDGTDEFSLVKDETYTGINPVWCQSSHRNGYEKFLKTMQQAATLQLRKSKAAHTTGLFGQSEMAGVCHMLVNDERIWWVKNSD